jgi:hypothetical protein
LIIDGLLFRHVYNILINSKNELCVTFTWKCMNTSTIFVWCMKHPSKVKIQLLQ